jgi:hypothetical protein
MMLPDFKDYHKLDPFIQALVNELSPYDFLGCSAALEILADIASGRRENIRHFEQIGLLSKVYDLFTFTKQSPDLGLIHIGMVPVYPIHFIAFQIHSPPQPVSASSAI